MPASGVMLQAGGLPNGTKPLRLLHHLSRLYADPVDVDDVARRSASPDFASTTVRRLSGGQKQRLALAASLLGRPEVLFLDEPAAGLDPHGRLDVWDLVAEQRDAGTTVVVTTHSFEEAERLADHLVIMNAGRTVAEGTPGLGDRRPLPRGRLLQPDPQGSRVSTSATPTTPTAAARPLRAGASSPRPASRSGACCATASSSSSRSSCPPWRSSGSA